MEIYFALMALMIWTVIILGFRHVIHRSDKMDPRPLTRPGPRPKAVPKFPFGPISDLIRDAEKRAEKEFYELFPEERPKPDPGTPPGGFAMDSSPKGIIVSNGVMTPNEWRERFQEQAGGEVMVLPESFEYHGMRYTPPKMIDVPTLGKPYRRYIEGIGIITADSEWKLDRACEVALMEKFRESSRDMREYDSRIRSLNNARPPVLDPSPVMAEMRDRRYDAWEKCKLYLGLLQELNL